RLDDLLGEGIPLGSTLLIAGVAGTGKTVLGLEFLYRGVSAAEKGLDFSFEETEERLRATARGLGWDLDGEIDRGMVEIEFIPQPDIMVEAHLLMMRERVQALGARRVVVDSVSVFLHKVKDPQIAREKTFQLATIVQNAQAVGFFATDIPYGSSQLSRFGVEETVVDGVILLTSNEGPLRSSRPPRRSGCRWARPSRRSLQRSSSSPGRTFGRTNSSPFCPTKSGPAECGGWSSTAPAMS